ncbi:GNAT family N-acetyltransferase [Cellulomonas palmilytica]|uniref:GNAT family N-acetyltransferase n=1 Tax=Cellulomonas palmilytica TaxID=2608402 RepID=UPI001F20071F|nr:GNAT family N-acetyltransferase [Cellulomonas palmilytica]UJP40182.1 GNAT family N-acetyltransferase [Cellulomonas palmilytica]
MRIGPTTSPADLTRVHDEVLRSSFPDDELADLPTLQAMLANGTLRLVVAHDEDGLRGAALAEWFPATGVLLLAYLAIAPGGRGGGVGSRLLDHAIDTWRTELDPWLVVAEVEDPAQHTGSEAHGDPTARLRFYRRHGARVIPLPYVQPAMHPGGPRVPGLLLLALCASGDRLAGVEADGRWLLPTAPLRAFLEQYFTSSEGAPPTGPDWDAIVAALTGPTIRV